MVATGVRMALAALAASRAHCCKDFLNPGIVWTDAFGGQPICRQVVRFEAAIIRDRATFPLPARLFRQRRI